MTRFFTLALSVIIGLFLAEGLEHFAAVPWLVARSFGGIAAVARYAVLLPTLNRLARTRSR
jgi:hypothetical protein